MKALAKAPGDRYESMQAFIIALERLMVGRGRRPKVGLPGGQRSGGQMPGAAKPVPAGRVLDEKVQMLVEMAEEFARMGNDGAALNTYHRALAM